MLFAIYLSILIVCVRASTVYCNSSLSCPESSPCCSQYGECGTGSYCLGGCNPAFSYSLDACMPMPLCKNSSTIFDNYASKLTSLDEYLGDASTSDWVYDGTVLNYDDENALILAMANESYGTVLSSTRYVWYGKVGVRMKSSHDAGVVTAFIIFSSVQDEIDNEFIGSNLTTVQTNFYFEGTLNYTNSKNMTTTDTFENYHDYEVDWQEDYMTWSIDGEVGRTLYKNETYNSTTKEYEYPQTPARVQLSLWPGGNSTNAAGTIAWAGGEIDWDSSDISDYGYYYAIVQSVNVTCYDPPSGTKVNGTKSYKYIEDGNFLQSGVGITDDDTVLGSLEDSGLNPNANESSSTTQNSTSTATSNSTSSHKSTSGSSLTDGSSITSTGSITSSTSSSSQDGFVQNIKSSSSVASQSSGGTAASTGGASGPIYGSADSRSVYSIIVALTGTFLSVVF